MLLNWGTLWNSLVEGSRRNRHSLSDPLEGAEWRGLLWIVPLLSRLVSARPPAEGAKGPPADLETSEA